MAADDPLLDCSICPYLPTSTFRTHTRLYEKVSRPRKDLPLRVEALSGAATHSMDKLHDEQLAVRSCSGHAQQHS